MTESEANGLKRVLDKYKVTIECTEILPGIDGSYSLLVFRLDGTEEILTNTVEANRALVNATRVEAIEGTCYATLGEDRLPILCDFKTWQEWSSTNQNQSYKIGFSPEIEAQIWFMGHSSSEDSMDGRPKFWALSIYNSTNGKPYGGGRFETEAEAKACVERYISEGCPAPKF
jgi:hypothetical protein